MSQTDVMAAVRRFRTLPVRRCVSGVYHVWSGMSPSISRTMRHLDESSSGMMCKNLGVPDEIALVGPVTETKRRMSDCDKTGEIYDDASIAHQY